MLGFGAVLLDSKGANVRIPNGNNPFKSTSKNPDEKTVQKLETRTENVETFYLLACQSCRSREVLQGKAQ